MKDKLIEVLNTIFAHLSIMKHTATSFLNDPEDELTVKNEFQRIGYKANNEILSLYKWKNGTSIFEGMNLDDIQIIPGFHFLSLQDSKSIFSKFKTNNNWNPAWFPIFANGGGDFYVIDLVKLERNEPYVIGFMLGEIEHDIEYESITTMMQTYCECFDKNIVFITKEGYLEMDDEKHAKIALKHNPKVEFWQI